MNNPTNCNRIGDAPTKQRWVPVSETVKPLTKEELAEHYAWCVKWDSVQGKRIHATIADLEAKLAKAERDLAQSREWRPIESAPRDGTPILVAYDRRAYGEKQGYEVCKDIVRWMDGEDISGWVYLRSSWHIVKGVTYWKPLDPPPTTGSAP